MSNVASPRPGTDCVARARCRYCEAELSVAGFDASAVLEALNALLRMHGWRQDASGLRVCPEHGPPAKEAA